MEYTLTIPELIERLVAWADARDAINQDNPLIGHSTTLREAAARLREADKERQRHNRESVADAHARGDFPETSHVRIAREIAEGKHEMGQ